MPTELEVSNAQLGELLAQVGLTDAFSADLLEGAQPVWKIRTGGATFFLKTHTRDWYDWNPPLAASLAVRHETSAYRILAEAGLSTPEIVLSEPTLANPIAWPVLLLRGLDGLPMTEQIVGADSSAFEEILVAAGAYLRRMHSIRFRHSGYLIDGAPKSPPNPNSWQHWIWTLKEFQRQAEATWEDDRLTSPGELIDEIMAFAAPLWEPMESQFEPPRFITGDCHAGHFFVAPINQVWEVTGVIDMEVASAGTPLADLFKLGVEMAGRFSADTSWWEPLFRGYGQEPDFDFVRLAFMAAEHVNFKCYGTYSWPGTRREILGHVLEAKDWRSLFQLRALSANG